MTQLFLKRDSTFTFAFEEIIASAHQAVSTEGSKTETADEATELVAESIRFLQGKGEQSVRRLETAATAKKSKKSSVARTMNFFETDDTPFPETSLKLSGRDYFVFGDYNNIVAQDNIVRPIWTRLDGEKLSIKTAIINVDSIGINASKGVVFNPDSIDYEVSELERIYVSFKLKGTQKLHLFLFNESGRKVKKIFKCKTFDFGKHILPYTVKELDLKPGRYSFRLQHKRKILKERFFQID